MLVVAQTETETAFFCLFFNICAGICFFYFCITCQLAQTEIKICFCLCQITSLVVQKHKHKLYAEVEKHTAPTITPSIKPLITTTSITTSIATPITISNTFITDINHTQYTNDVNNQVTYKRQ
jgi:poly(A) polymerase Pap1